MIVPSIDLQNGQAVQLIGGEKKAIDAGNPLPIAEAFSLAGELAVIDLDAALGAGSNREIIQRLVREYPCRVGGGIRDFETALAWLDAGASKIIIGTKAEPELLRKLPKERVIAALDAREGEVVIEGWTKGTGKPILERMLALREFVGGFLVTFVEKEGRMQGTRLDMVEELVRAAGSARLTIAGGVTTKEEIAELDRLGADAQVGMALYTKHLHLADAISAPLRSDRPDGLWPTVVSNESGLALGLAYSNAESLRLAVESRRGVYFSRKRGIWEKGKTSGATQELLGVDLDCDRDTLRFRVRQTGSGFCHQGTSTCFGPASGFHALIETLSARRQSAPPGSYSARLFSEPNLLSAKLREEAEELIAAKTREEIIHEAADLFYFTLTRLVGADIPLEAVETELDRRQKKVSRRGGEAKTEKSRE